jgi:hypothetical protein
VLTLERGSIYLAVAVAIALLVCGTWFRRRDVT